MPQKPGTSSSKPLKAITPKVANPELQKTGTPDASHVDRNQILVSPKTSLPSAVVTEQQQTSAATAALVEDAPLGQMDGRSDHVSVPIVSNQLSISTSDPIGIGSTEASKAKPRPKRNSPPKANPVEVDQTPKLRGRLPKVIPLQPTTRFNAKFNDPFKRPPQNETSKTTQVHIEDNNLVSFSYRRQRCTDLGTSTKEVSIQFCDNSENEFGDETNDHAAAPKRKSTTTKPMANKKRKKSKTFFRTESELSESEEILPVSKRMADKRRSEAITKNIGVTTMSATLNNATIGMNVTVANFGMMQLLI